MANGTLDDASKYVINQIFNRPISRKQQAAWDSLDDREKRFVREQATGQYVAVPPEPRTAITPPTTAGSAPGSNPPSTSTAGTPAPGRRPSRPSIVDTQSTSLGRRIAESLMETFGDPRTMTTVSNDVRETKRMEEEREMNVAGRKKGGMVKKKKAPVKKAYGGMVKKKQGGSARKVNMKAGFTRRGCSKG
jgi:hypothetical protein